MPLPEVLAELPEVVVPPEVAELSEVAGLWKGLLQLKGGLTEKRLGGRGCNAAG